MWSFYHFTGEPDHICIHVGLLLDRECQIHSMKLSCVTTHQRNKTYSTSKTTAQFAFHKHEGWIKLRASAWRKGHLVDRGCFFIHSQPYIVWNMRGWPIFQAVLTHAWNINLLLYEKKGYHSNSFNGLWLGLRMRECGSRGGSSFPRNS